MEWLEKFLKDWKNEKGCKEDSYHQYKWSPVDDEISFEDELIELMLNNLSKFKRYKFTYIGGFDSCGYDIDCYSLSIITNDGELIVYPINFECY